MTDGDRQRDERIAEVLEKVEFEFRARGEVDLDTWRTRCPDLADDLPALVDTLRAFKTAVDDCRADALDTRAGVDSAETGEWRPGMGPAPTQLGRYVVTGLVGAGGMGTVYRARDPQLGREVAVKLPHFRGPVRAGREAAARFQREARAAAAVRHPHVCPIYDVGEWDGRPYVVMAFVAGQSAADLTAAGPVAPPAAVEIVRQVAEGLAAIHAHGIVHRDIKPANILLDAGGQALIADFGLAQFDAGGERITADRTMLGTPAYMAPEQASLTAGEVSPAADVYSLGAVLYELLTGQPPYRGDPVTVIYQVAQQAPPPPSLHSPGLDSALEAIVLKAMARDPAARYPGALAFAGALQRWLGGEDTAATSARPQPVATLVRRHPIRRFAAMVVAAGLLAAVLFGGVMITLRTREGSIVITVPESDVKLFIDDEERASLVGQKVGRLDLKPGKHRLTVKRDGASVYELTFDVKAGQTVDLTAKFPPRSPGDDLLRELARKHIPETERFDWQPDELVAVFGTHAWRHWGDFHNTDGPLLGFAENGKNLIAVNRPGRAGSDLRGDTLRVTDAATGKDLATFTLPKASRTAYLPEAGLVGLLAGEHGNWRWKLWSLATKNEKVTLAGDGGMPQTIVAAPGGKLLATASGSNHTILWDAATGNELHRFDLPTEGFSAGAAAAFSSDGKLLAVTWSRADGTGNNTLLRVYDVTARKEVHAATLTGKCVGATPAFTPDAKALLLPTECMRRNKNDTEQGWGLLSWNLPAGKWSDLQIPGEGSLAVSRAGNRIAFANAVLDPATGEKATALDGPPVPFSCVFSPDGNRVAGANTLGVIAVHDVARGKTLTPTPDLVGFLAVSNDGTTVAVPQFHGTNTFPNVLRLRDALTGKDRATLRLPEAQGFVSAAFLADGTRLVAANSAAPAGLMQVWDVATGDPLHSLPHAQVDRVAPSADGKWLVSGGYYASDIKIWDTSTWNERTVIKLKTIGVNALAISPDGKLVAGLTELGVNVYEADGGKAAFTIPGTIYSGPCTFSADGTRLAFDGKMYDTSTGKAVATLANPTPTWGLIFAPDGKSLFTSGADGRLVRRSAADGAVLREWHFPGMIDRIALTANGRYLFTSNHNGTVYILRLDPPAGKKNP